MDENKAREALRKFKELREDGLISNAEYENKKKMILDQLSSSILQEKSNPRNAEAISPPSSASTSSQPKKLDIQCVAEMNGHSNYVFSIATSGLKLFSASSDQSMKVWDLQSLKCLSTMKDHSSATVSSLAASDKYVFSGGWDNAIKVYDTNSLALLQDLKGHNNYVSSLLYNKQSNTLFSGSWDSNIQTWELQQNKFVPKNTMLKENTGGKHTGGHSGPVTTLAFLETKNNFQLLVSGSQDNSIKIWSTQFECKRTLLEHSNWVYSLTTFGGKIYSASRDCTVRVWDAETAKCVKVIQDKEYQTAICMHPSGKYFFVASMDKTIKVFDSQSYECIEELRAHTGNVSCLLYAHDTLYSGSWDKSIRVWQ